MDTTSTEGQQKRSEVIRLAKFLVFSLGAGIIQVISFTLLHEVAALPYWPSYLVALVLSVLFNFTVNRRYTFKSTANIPRAMTLLALYYVVFTPASTWWGDALTTHGWNEYIVLGGTMVINFATEFLFNRFVIYRSSLDNRP